MNGGRNMRLKSWIATCSLCILQPYVYADNDDEVVPGQVVVRLAQGANISAFLARYNVSAIDTIVSRRIWLLSVPVGDEEEFVDEIEFDPDVQWAEPNYTGRDLDPDPDTQSIFVAGTYGQYINQPSMGIIGLPQAQSFATGQGILVAVLDSGLDTQHPELLGSIAPGGWNYVDNNGVLADVGDGIDSNNNGIFDELVGHGTLVAGLIVRVAPDAMILPLKVLDSDGLTSTFTLVKGIYHAVDASADVVNISMGSTVDTMVLGGAIADAVAAGVVVVASAGNEDTSSPVRYPAGYASLGVISVASTDNSDVRSHFSNFGFHITLCAPGNSITSTVPGGGFGRASGTSFAAPLVAGGAALVKQRHINAPPHTIALTLANSSRRIANVNSGYEELLGSGRIDLLRAMLRSTPSGLHPASSNNVAPAGAIRR